MYADDEEMAKLEAMADEDSEEAMGEYGDEFDFGEGDELEDGII